MNMPGESAKPFYDGTRSVSRPNSELASNAKDGCSAFELVERRKRPTGFSKEARQVYSHSRLCNAVRKTHHKGMKARDFVDHNHRRPNAPSKYGSGPAIMGEAEAMVAVQAGSHRGIRPLIVRQNKPCALQLTDKIKLKRGASKAVI